MADLEAKQITAELEVLSKESHCLVHLLHENIGYAFPQGLCVLAFFVFDIMGGNHSVRTDAIIPCIMLGVSAGLYMLWGCIGDRLSQKLTGCKSNVGKGSSEKA